MSRAAHFKNLKEVSYRVQIDTLKAQLANRELCLLEVWNALDSLDDNPASDANLLRRRLWRRWRDVLPPPEPTNERKHGTSQTV